MSGSSLEAGFLSLLLTVVLTIVSSQRLEQHPGPRLASVIIVEQINEYMLRDHIMLLWVS